MSRRALASILLLAIGLAGCGRQAEPSMAAAGAMAPAAEAMAAAPAMPGDQPAGRRYLAVSHSIEVETAAERVEPLWRSVQAKCAALGGEVTSAELSRGEVRSPNAQLSLRLPPQQVPALFALLAEGGELVNTRTDSEDKTAEVIDVEARLKNLTDARDRLRQMLADRTGKLSDVLEVQKALTETQSQLDSYAGQRAALAQQTDKVRVELNIHAPRSAIERSALAPLRDAWHSIGFTAAASFAGLLTFVAAALPWLLLVVPAFVLIRRRWRKRRAA